MSGSLAKQTGNEPTDEEWVQRIQAGSYPAFEALFRAYYEKLVAFAVGFVRKREIAEELVQELFFNIWQGRQRWTPRGTLQAYLFGAARNNSLKHLRQQRTTQRIRAQLQSWTTPVSDTPADALQLEEFGQAVRRAIDDLPERRRQIYLLSREQGMSYAEIAAVLDLSINTVENQMVRALKFLRERLAVYHTSRA